MNTWENCESILCIRADNMGDLLMSSPAINALKQTFGCKISVLTSPMAKGIAGRLPGVDDVLVWEAPWVKGDGQSSAGAFEQTVHTLARKRFDAAVIFTVFSQSPLPAALLATLSGIPNRLAYCRENPYQLLSHWVPDQEPYTFIRHQVRRDLDLVRTIGATQGTDTISLRDGENSDARLNDILIREGIDVEKPWLLIHPGVSENKRAFKPEKWIETGKEIVGELRHQVIVTGNQHEAGLASGIANAIGAGAVSLAGLLSLDEFTALIRRAPLLISVNSGPVHLASATKTKVIVLYALTNPQHPPWQTVGKVFPFSVPEAEQSRNEVLRFVQQKYYGHRKIIVNPEEIVEAARELLAGTASPLIPELVLPFNDPCFTEYETP